MGAKAVLFGNVKAVAINLNVKEVFGKVNSNKKKVYHKKQRSN